MDKCKNCDGRGYNITTESPAVTCKNCKGSGLVKAKKEVNMPTKAKAKTVVEPVKEAAPVKKPAAKKLVLTKPPFVAKVLKKLDATPVEAPVVEPVTVPVEVKVTAVKWAPMIGEKCLFSNDMTEFVASIDSFAPLTVTRYSIKGGCVSDSPVFIKSLDEYEITQLTRAEEVARLSDAGI